MQPRFLFIAWLGLTYGCTHAVSVRPADLPRGGVPHPKHRPVGGLALQTTEGGHVLNWPIDSLEVLRRGRVERFEDPMALKLERGVLMVQAGSDDWQTLPDAELIVIEEYSSDNTGWLATIILISVLAGFGALVHDALEESAATR